MSTTDEIFKQAQETSIRLKADADKRIEDMNNEVVKLEERSIANFSAWREYLYKYYALIFSVITIASAFISKDTRLPRDLLTAIYVTLGGVFIGTLLVNLYFYFERKWAWVTSIVSSPNSLHNHPSVTDGNFIQAIKKNLDEYNKLYKSVLDKKIDLNSPKYIEIGDKKLNEYNRKQLKRFIKNNKKHIRLLKYIGSQFTFVEKIWIIGIVVSLLFSWVGIFMFISAL
jgi:hypothetical protein